MILFGHPNHTAAENMTVDSYLGGCSTQILCNVHPDLLGKMKPHHFHKRASFSWMGGGEKPPTRFYIPGWIHGTGIPTFDPRVHNPRNRGRKLIGSIGCPPTCTKCTPPEALPRGYDYHVSAEIREMRKALHLGDDGALTPRVPFASRVEAPNV